MKGKLKDKDLYIQNQTGKLIKLQTGFDKSQLELGDLKKKNVDLKSENVKLSIKTKEQTFRILELREKNDKAKKEIDNKVRNRLIEKMKLYR